MIRIKTLRKLIEITRELVEVYYTSSRHEYMSFEDHLELLDIESLARAVGLSERTMYDYVSAIKELYEILRTRCHDETDVGHDMTDVKGAEIL